MRYSQVTNRQANTCSNEGNLITHHIMNVNTGFSVVLCVPKQFIDIIFLFSNAPVLDVNMSALQT